MRKLPSTSASITFQASHDGASLKLKTEQSSADLEAARKFPQKFLEIIARI